MGKFTTEEEANGGFNIAEVNIPIWSHGDLHMEIYLLQVLGLRRIKRKFIVNHIELPLL